MSKLRLLLAAVAALTLILVGGVQHQPATAFTDDNRGAQPISNARILSAAGWGSKVTGLSGIVNLGPTAPTSFACTQRTNVDFSNGVTSIEIPGVAEVGAIETYSRSTKVGTVESAIGGSEIAGASLLGGAIQVGAITSESTASWRPNGTFSGTAETEIASLNVLGEEIVITGGPQTINVPGLATITLGQEIVRPGDQAISTAAIAVQVRVFESGALITLGESRAAIDGSGVRGLFGGQSYASRLTVGGTVQAGPITAVNPPCLGTNGVPSTQQTAGANLGSIGSIGAAQASVTTWQNPRAELEATSEVGQVSLLGGLASINGISSSVNVWRNGDGSLGYETDAEISSITVAGLDIQVPTVPGSTLGLPGVGTLTFHDVQSTDSGNGVAVTAVKLDLLGGQVLELGRSAGVIIPVQ